MAARSTHADSEGTDGNLDTVGASLLDILGSFRLASLKDAVEAHQVSSSEASYRSGNNPHFVSMEDKLQTIL